MTKFIPSSQCASKSPFNKAHFISLYSAVIKAFSILDKISYFDPYLNINILPYKSLLSIDLGFKSFDSVSFHIN